MSRIGNKPVQIPAGVEVAVDGNHIAVKGSKGTLEMDFYNKLAINVEDGVLTVSRPDDERETRARHGLTRALIANMVEGVTNGYSKGLVINGVGYKVAKQGNKVVLNVGYSHSVEVVEPAGITFECPSATEITVKGIDRCQVGQVAANIRAIRVPDPYHAYGIRYSDEVIARKEGKKAGKK